jgi:endonuclease/exonuclease/phosphatase family metal-dependent hydrolase
VVLDQAAWRVLAPGVIAVLLLASRGLTPNAARWAAILLVPLAFVAHGAQWDGMPFGSPIAAVGIFPGMLAAAVVALAAFAAPGRGGAREAAAGWAAGAMLFVVIAFLYYVGYDIRMAFSNVGLVPALAATAALLVVPGFRRIERLPRLPVLDRPITLFLLTPLLAIPLLMLSGRPSGDPEGLGFPVRVMSYNVHQGYGISGSQDLEALARTVEAADADIVALQEVSRGWVIDTSADMVTWLAQRLNMPYVWGPTADALWGNAILSRYPIEQVQIHAMPNNEAVRPARGFIDATLNIGGQPLNVIATHLHHIGADGVLRVPQVQALLAAWAQRPATIVLGDLNALPDSPEMQLLREAGLLDAFTSSGAGGEGFTFRSDGLNRRIDYIYHSPDLIARDFHVNPSQASDHAALAVTLAAE